MSDVMQVALERQRELRDEIARIEQFIRQAEDLLRMAKSKPDVQAGERTRPEPLTDTAKPEGAEAEPTEQQPDEPQAAKPVLPWRGAAPTASPATGGEDALGPTRRNIFRRDISVTA